MSAPSTMPDLSKPPPVDNAVCVAERVTRLKTRSLKKESKMSGLRLALSTLDRKALEDGAVEVASVATAFPSGLAPRCLLMVRETLGPDWLTPDLFRFGASSLANDLLMQIVKPLTGVYQAPEILSGGLGSAGTFAPRSIQKETNSDLYLKCLKA